MAEQRIRIPSLCATLNAYQVGRAGKIENGLYWRPKTLSGMH
jgi:hypothetical protein